MATSLLALLSNPSSETSAQTQCNVSLSWGEYAGAIHYSVNYNDDGSGNYSNSGFLGADARSFSFPGIDGSSWSVFAWTSYNLADAHEISSGQADCPNPTPEKLRFDLPEGCVDSSYELTLRWQNSGDGWYLDISTDSGFDSYYNKNVSNRQSTSAPDGFSNVYLGNLTLEPNTTYYWRIYNGETQTNGPSFSKQGCATPTPTSQPTPVQPPPAPGTISHSTGVSGDCTNSNYRPTLSWLAVPEAGGYKVKIRADTPQGTTEVSDVGNVTSAQVGSPGLEPGTNYYWTVLAYNAAGDGPYHDPEEKISLPRCAPVGGPPPPPTITPATDLRVGSHSCASGTTLNVDFTWKVASGGDFDLQYHDWSTRPAGDENGQEVPVGREFTTRYSLPHKTTIYWRVNSRTTAGVWHPSEVQSFPFPDCGGPPPPPTATPSPTPTPPPPPPAGQITRPVLGNVIDTAKCDETTGKWTVTFRWTPGSLYIPEAGISHPPRQQWVDLKINDGQPFINDLPNFSNAGPLDGQTSQYTWAGIEPQTSHLWRVANFFPGDSNPYYPERNGNFAFGECGAVTPPPPVTCQPGAIFGLVEPKDTTRESQPTFYWEQSVGADQYFLDLSDNNFGSFWFVAVDKNAIVGEGPYATYIAHPWPGNWNTDYSGGRPGPAALVEDTIYQWRVSAFKDCPGGQNDHFTVAGPSALKYQPAARPRKINPATLAHVSDSDQAVDSFFAGTIDVTFRWTPSANSQPGDAQWLYLKYADDAKGAPTKSNSVNIGPIDRVVSSIGVGGDGLSPGLTSDKDHTWTIDTYDPVAAYTPSLASPDQFKTIKTAGPPPTPPPRQEICTNGADDDGDGKTDYNDPDCPPNAPSLDKPDHGATIDLSREELRFSWKTEQSAAGGADYYWVDVTPDLSFGWWWACNAGASNNISWSKCSWEALKQTVGGADFDSDPNHAPPQTLVNGRYYWRVAAGITNVFCCTPSFESRVFTITGSPVTPQPSPSPSPSPTPTPQPTPPPDFTFNITETKVTVEPGQLASYSINITYSPGWTDLLTLSPNHGQTLPDQPTIHVGYDLEGSSNVGPPRTLVGLGLQTEADTALGEYFITIHACTLSGSICQKASTRLIVQPRDVVDIKEDYEKPAANDVGIIWEIVHTIAFAECNRKWFATGQQHYAASTSNWWQNRQYQSFAQIGADNGTTNPYCLGWGDGGDGPLQFNPASNHSTFFNIVNSSYYKAGDRFQKHPWNLGAAIWAEAGYLRRSAEGARDLMRIPEFDWYNRLNNNWEFVKRVTCSYQTGSPTLGCTNFYLERTFLEYCTLIGGTFLPPLDCRYSPPSLPPPIPPPSAGPDLVVSNLTVSPQTVSAGQTITVTAVIKNNGSSPASTFYNDLGIGSVTNPCSSSSTPYRVDTLAPGQETAITTTLHAPATTGTYNVVFYTDVTCVVLETNEANNTQSSPFQVGPAESLVTPCTTIVNRGKPAEKLDITFIPVKYKQEEMPQFSSVVNSIVSEGLHFYIPFSQKKSFINAHRVDKTSTILDENLDPLSNPSDLSLVGLIRELAGNCPYDQIVVIINQTGGGAAWSHLDIAFVSGKWPDAPRVAMHEIGHSFGTLAEEYVFADTGDTRPAGAPNCSKSADSPPWKNVNGTKIGLQGCSTLEWYRPTENSIMRHHNQLRADAFDPWNIKILSDLLKNYE